MQCFPPQTEILSLTNGESATLPFSDAEYERRLAALRNIMVAHELDAVLLTSMHNIAYYSGFLHCSFGRSYACLVTWTACTTVSANIDGGQPGRRSFADNLIYTDWQRDNYWRALQSLLPMRGCIGYEADQLSKTACRKAWAELPHNRWSDISDLVMRRRMVKSAEEIALIRAGAAIADRGGKTVYDAVRPEQREMDIAMAGRDAIELAIAEDFPDSELRDTWVWIQSGFNTDGAHNPVTPPTVKAGDLLTMNTFPMISGYYTALEGTLFLGEPDPETLRIWQTNVTIHKLGASS